MPDIRYEITHDGRIEAGETALSNRLDELVEELFSQNGWRYEELEKRNSVYRKARITSLMGDTYEINLFTAKLRNERRSPYEKKIQLNGENPNQYRDEATLILGFYVSDANDGIEDAIIVGYSVNEAVGYETNPSLRGAFVNDILIKAKQYGIHIDDRRRLAGFRSPFIFYYLMNYAKIHGYLDNHYTDEAIRRLRKQPLITPSPHDESIRKTGGYNIILYGVPGAGKSWTIAHEYCAGTEYMERLVFHPDYMYSDFIGQILPVVRDERVQYEFMPGPFTKLLKRAYEDPDNMYYLVIEEINRGNAPAIFGEVFQLLDRVTKEGGDYPPGTSEYAIMNANIAKSVYGEEGHEVRIPSNLTIIGTMNTSDQNVFALDTAFQRRFAMRLIPNSFENHPFAEECILDTTVSWEMFGKAINEEILRKNQVTSAEDKRLGAYFIDEEDLAWHMEEDTQPESSPAWILARHKNARFGEKVLKYLWDDVFRYERQEIFDTKSYASLEYLLDAFCNSRGNDRFQIFHENIRKAIIEGADNT